MSVFYANLAGVLLFGGGAAGMLTVAAIIATDQLRPVNLYHHDDGTPTPTHLLRVSTDPSDPWRLPFITASPLTRPIEYAAEYVSPSRKPSTTIRERYAYHGGSARHGAWHGVNRPDAVLSTTLTDELKAESLSMYGQSNKEGTST